MGDSQDIRLGQLLDEAKDAVKDQFCKITVEKLRRTKEGAVEPGPYVGT